ncbi:phospholipid/cholesterol/gamma-HCH transport system substrate-binding protein [Rhodococcus rhodochrous J45]|uniref:Phospholipid/cholesterol/gamma-HCH transport system substrate-binding protein n=1 Tax=Rhodococcus rhodochrous J45 TaxID=935266 RepID=A0A562DJS1_RHORH|nr:MCE family protein [Rhodococcus rhodochrous]TWH09841.1 phospholipid/cholesterol/gamma-HCH transport system substrate-binding protein [Rhodococcus rhodochrous J45]
MTRLRPLISWGVPILLLAVVAVVSFTVAPWRSADEYAAEFTSSRGLYVGDDVRIMGVEVGRVTKIEPRGDRVLVRFDIDSERRIPADAQAAIVAPTLVSARFVQLTPPHTGGPELPVGATIPVERTAVPVEWDEITEQLTRLTTELGPDDTDPQGALGEVLDVAAANAEGHGPALRDSLQQLATAMRTISDGRHDLFGTLGNLQVFVEALSMSGDQIVSFHDRLASVTEILDANRDDMGAALAGLDAVLVDVERFVRDNRERVDTTVDRTAALTETLAAQRDGIAQVLHVAPTALSNLQGIYQPAHNTVVSALSLTNFANPAQFVCSALAAAEQVDAHTASELCVQYLGPILPLLAMDYPPVRINPTRGVGALPDQLVYTEPELMPAPGAPSPTSLADLLSPGAP